MRKILNPFITSGYISEEFFCDRETESAILTKSITQGNNIAIISPRRMGKTGLIKHCFHQQNFSEKYYTIFIDIYATGNLREFVYTLGKEIFDTLKPRGRKFIDQFFAVISSLRPAFKLDTITGEPTFDIGLGELHQANITLEEIFNYLEGADKPSIVAIDEFQQIAKYPEKNIEAILRTHVQHCKNAQFIYAGSQRHLMENIFFSASRPFYQSVGILQLNAIEKQKYIPFVNQHFNQANKSISNELIDLVYEMFEGHTWYIQNIFNELFALTERGEICTPDLVKEAISNKIASYEPLFQSTLTLLTERQREVLYTIAKEGKATAVTSAGFIKKHGLLSSSSVQTSIRQLLDKEIITSENNEYLVYDRFFGLWLTTIFGTGYRMEMV
jgi:AAA+ ATPase superfamily predicted ATPase